MCTLATVIHLHINAITAVQGIMGCYGKRPSVLLYSSPWLFLNVRCSVRLEKAIERSRLYGQHHWLKCPSVTRMTVWLAICWRKQSTVQHLFRCKWILWKGKWKRGMHYSSLLLIHVWFGGIYFNGFANEVLTYVCDYSVEGPSNNSPGDLSVSWKVGIWIGVACFRHYHSDSVVGLKRSVTLCTVLSKMNKLPQENLF